MNFVVFIVIYFHTNIFLENMKRKYQISIVNYTMSALDIMHDH